MKTYSSTCAQKTQEMYFYRCSEGENQSTKKFFQSTTSLHKPNQNYFKFKLAVFDFIVNSINRSGIYLVYNTTCILLLTFIIYSK